MFEIENIEHRTPNIEHRIESGAEARAVQTQARLPGASNFAKRLECARFTAAFHRDIPDGQTKLAAVICLNLTTDDRDRSQMVIRYLVGVMIKIVTSWILIVIGGLLSVTAVICLGVFLYSEIRMRLGPHTIPLQPTMIPDGIGTQIPCFRYTFWTTPWVLVIGYLSIGLFVVAVGLHLHYLHHLDVGRERLEEKEKIQMHDTGHNASNDGLSVKP